MIDPQAKLTRIDIYDSAGEPFLSLSVYDDRVTSEIVRFAQGGTQAISGTAKLIYVAETKSVLELGT